MTNSTYLFHGDAALSPRGAVDRLELRTSGARTAATATRIELHPS
jgi:hypothetical protein